MNKNNNNIKNIYIKCTKTYNKNTIPKNNYHKNDTKEENMIEKNNIIFIKNDNLIEKKFSGEKINPSSTPNKKKPYKSDTYNFKNDKKKILNGNNIMTIHNINLINSTNNITVYDSIPNIKKDYMKYPINKYNSQQFIKNKNFNIKNNSSVDFNINKNPKNNIIVNKKNFLIDKNINSINNNIGYSFNTKTYKNDSLSKKKNPFKELNYKKLNLPGNNKSVNKFNKGNNYSNFNKQEKNIKTLNTNTEYIINREVFNGDLSQSKNINNSLNKRLWNDNTTNNNDLSAYITCSNYTSSIGEEEFNINKNKIFIDKISDINNRNIINVNKLENIKINSNIKSNNIINHNQNLFNFYKNDNNSNIKINSNSSSNIFSLISNKNKDNYNKQKFDIENLNKIKKNINNEKIYKTKSIDTFNNNTKFEKNKKLRCGKTKSEEKDNKKKKENKINENKNLTQKIKIFSSFLNENHKKNNNNISKKNGIGNIYINDLNHYNKSKMSSFNNTSKLFYSTFNSENVSRSLTKIQKKKKNIYPNKINEMKEIPHLVKMNIANNNNENYNESNFFEKIAVNKASFPKLSLSKNNKKLNIKKSNENLLETRNESLNFYVKKAQKESWINNSEQANSFSKNIDYYCYLSNYKGKKDERPKNSRKNSAPKTVSNVVYNKKQLLCNKKLKPSLEEKIVSPDSKKRKNTSIDYGSKSNDKKYISEDIYHNSKLKNDNYYNDEREESICNINYNSNTKENIDNITEKDIEQKLCFTNKSYFVKSPTSAVYKKPGISNNSNSLIPIGKESFNNKLVLYSGKINENENENENYTDSSKKKKKIYLNFKLNKFKGHKEFLINNKNDKRFKKNKININLNSINYNAEELIPKTNKNIFIQTINSYKPIKNDLINKEINKSKEYIVNNEQFSVTKINKKVNNINSFTYKYYCYFIDYSVSKQNCCFVSKIRLNKKELTLYEIPIKKICYFSKKRKIFTKIMPKIEICYIKKDLMKNNKIRVMNNNYINDENIMINNEFDINKKEFDDNNIKYNVNQNSFASINSNETGNNYFEISFGKKINKSLININNENIKNSSNNNNGNILNKLISSEGSKEDEIKANNNYTIDNNENKFSNKNIIDISPSKKYIKTNIYINNPINNNNDVFLKKTEKGLKLLEKIAGNRISPFSNKKINIFTNKKNEDELNIKNNDDNKINNKDKDKDKNNMNNNSKVDNNIKNDFIELLNMITVNNYDFILNKISYIILNNNIITIDNISQLLWNQNEFIDIILNKAMTEKKYIKIYSKLCKDLFISLMSIIDNYNDDMDIFDKITKDKSLKVILKNKIIEKIQNFTFPSKNISKNDLYYDLKLKFNYLIDFLNELMEIKLISLKSGFEILDLLYKQYIKGNNDIKCRIYNDLYLEGIEILLNKMKRIIYEKNNLEHIQRYNKFIKNYLNNIFKNRIKCNDLSKYLYYKLLNLIENQKNEEEIKKQKKTKTFINYKNKLPKINDFNNNKNIKILNPNNKNNLFIEEKKENEIDFFSHKNTTENNMIEIIKKDIEKFIYEPNINQIKYDLFKDINRRYNEELNIKKSIDIWEIFYFYIEICIDLINNEKKIYIVNEYIENIINNFIIDLPNESWEMLHFKLISLFLNINEICTDNIYMHEVMGFLLFLLINYKLFFIKDLNNFLNKDNEIIINIAKVVKYTIIFADKDAKKYHNDFKQTKLFIGNDNFYNIVTKPLSKKYL